MNLFILDRQPEEAARQNNDLHVRKIILEVVEMMGYAYDPKHFKPLPWLHSTGQYFNHPMSKWVRRSRQNFDWALQHAYGLSKEFSYRNINGKIHAYQRHIDWIASNLPMDNLSDFGQTDWPRCFGLWKEKIELTDDAVRDYRAYYLIAKRHLAQWTKRPQPEWWR